MKTPLQLINPIAPVKTSHASLYLTRGFLSLLLGLTSALLPTARAVDGGYPSGNTAEGEDALFNLTTGADNTAIGFDALYGNITESDNALTSWIWRPTNRLDTRREDHTATLLENGMVLVAAGYGGIPGSPL